MSANIPQHQTSSSLDEARVPQPFLSTPPSFGQDNQRQPVAPEGVAALPGFALPPAAPPAAPQEERLRSITELTYGVPEPPPEAVPGLPEFLPAAGRTPIPDTRIYPWRANAALIITVPGHAEPFLGTGWFVGPHAVITAGHAVYTRQPGGHVGWVTSVKVVPALNGFPIPDVPPFDFDETRAFEAPIAWQQQGVEALDYGVVLLKKGLGLKVGTFGFSTFSSNDILSSVANLSGYPVLSPDNTQPRGRQWYGAGNVTGVDDSFVFYNIGAMGGDSGSCVFRNIGEQPFAMAIHTGASGGTNRGVRITASVYANLQRWASMRG
jgi:V8-like Glu-specific endopeptidase